jgi:hypothetical protein
MDKIELDGMLRATASQTNPLTTSVEFVFTDFLPNKNKQGVPREETANLIATGIDMPVKADFRRGKIGDHPFSFPVGHITHLEARDDQIIGRGVIYKDEFPELAGHLEKASASESGVHFSWELYHGGHSVDDAGVTWFKDCVVAATTIVANPAYGGRTPLLAMASEDMTERIKELERQVASLQLTIDGSNHSMDPMEELKQQVADLTARFTTLETQQPTEETQEPVISPDVAALTSELEELRTFKADMEKQQARAAVITTRREALKDVLNTEEFDKKADFIADLTDAQFTTFSESLASVAQKTKQSASFRGITLMPDPLGSGDTSDTSISGLAKALREVKH